MMVIPGLFDGEHILTIEPLETDHVRFVQHEIFTGLLVPLFAHSLSTNTQRGFRRNESRLESSSGEAVTWSGAVSRPKPPGHRR